MTQGRPTAAPAMTRNSKGALCYPDHPNMAVVMRDEELDEWRRRSRADKHQTLGQWAERERRSARG